MRATLGLNGLIKYLQNLVAITFLRLSKAYLALCQASMMEKLFSTKNSFADILQGFNYTSANIWDLTSRFPELLIPAETDIILVIRIPVNQKQLKKFSKPFWSY